MVKVINLTALKSEITTDPISLGYSGKTDLQVCDLMNAVGTPGPGYNVDVKSINGAQLACAIDPVEFSLLTASNRQYVAMVCSSYGGLTVSLIKEAFGNIFTQASSPLSRAAILALFPKTLSRAEKLFDEKVTPSNIADARRA